MRLDLLKDKLLEYGISPDQVNDLHGQGWREGNGSRVYAPRRRAAFTSAYQAARHIDPSLPETLAELRQMWKRDDIERSRQQRRRMALSSSSESEDDVLEARNVRRRFDSSSSSDDDSIPPLNSNRREAIVAPVERLSAPVFRPQQTTDPARLLEYVTRYNTERDAYYADLFRQREEAFTAALHGRRRDENVGQGNRALGSRPRPVLQNRPRRRPRAQDDLSNCMIFDENDDLAANVPVAAAADTGASTSTGGDLIVDDEDGGGRSVSEDEEEVEAINISEIVDEIMERDLEWHGVTKKIREHVNFDTQSVLNAFTFRGAMFAFSMEQSEKTFFELVLVVLASIIGRPVMMIAGLTKPGTFELTMKMASTLRESFGVETTFCDGQISSFKRMTSNEVKQRFLCGKHFIVMPSYAQHRTEYLNEVDAKKVLVLMDESDVVMKRIEWAPNSKEAKLIEIIGRPHEDSSRVTGVVNVSATHMGDMYLWKRVMGNVPQDSVFVPPDLLKSRGFTTQDEMTLFSSRVSQDDAKPPKQYGLESRGFKDLMHDFMTCSGRRKLMMVASCPRVSAGASTLYTQARRVLQDDMDPQAIVMVHHSGKCVALLRDQNGTIIEKHMRKRQVLNAGSITSPRRVRIVNITTAGEALTKLENMYCQNGVDRRFIAIGYNAFARTASVRTSTMVITHMFAFLTKGRHSADVRQTLMRPAGRTTNVRKENNGGVETHVKVVTPMEDWHMVTELYKFQVWLAEKRMEDPSFDMVNALCPLEYDPVVASNRSHAPNTMKFRPEWRVDATRQERRFAANARTEEQIERERERGREREPVAENESEDEDNHNRRGVDDFVVNDRVIEYEDDPSIVSSDEKRGNVGHDCEPHIPFFVQLNRDDDTLQKAWAEGKKAGVIATKRAVSDLSSRYNRLIEDGFVHAGTLKIEDTSSHSSIQGVVNIANAVSTKRRIRPYGVKSVNTRSLSKYLTTVVDIRSDVMRIYVMYAGR